MADTPNLRLAISGLGHVVAELQEENATLQEQVQHLTAVVDAARAYRDSPRESQRAARTALFAALGKLDG